MPLVISRNESLSLEDDIIAQLSEDKSLVLQRGIATVPSLSSHNIGQKTIGIGLPVHFSVNLPSLLKTVTDENGIYDFGGIILYGYNLENIKSLANYKEFVGAVRKYYTFDIYIKIVSGERPNDEFYKVRIAPLIVADCDLSYGQLKYCRGPFLSQVIGNPGSLEERQALFSKILEEFSAIGLNSTLSPEVDIRQYEPVTVDSAVSLALVASQAAHKYNMVPALKHFMYDVRLGDTHAQSPYNPISDAEFRQGLAPYVAVEALNIPYFIMVTHHRLPMDPEHPLPMSEKVVDFIRTNFKNALTISDEIKMGGLQESQLGLHYKGSSFYHVATSVKTDLILFHSGNITFSITDIVRGIRDSNTAQSRRSVRKYLSLKHDLGLLQITKVSGTYSTHN
jgi:hypothetical protein